MNSETGKAILTLGGPQPIPAPLLSSQSRNDKISFPLDNRNPGGRKAIEIGHKNHKRALNNIDSEIGKEMKPPHAHINNVTAARNKFGQDKAHLKNYAPIRKSILNR